jgi:hypothetical protein
MPNEPTARLLPEAGYFILRTGAREWIPASALMLVFKTNSWSRAHSHFDALSLSFYANGQPILSGPGYPDYNPGTNRLAIIGTQNQNTVSVDGGSQALVVAKVNFKDIRWTSDDEKGPHFVAIQAEAETYPGVEHRRSLFYGPERTAILVIDELTSKEDHVFRQNFRLAPDVYAESRGMSIVAKASSDNRFLAKIDTKIYQEQQLSNARPVLTTPVISFPGQGRRMTYITTISTEDIRDSVTLDALKSAIRWDGSDGTLNVPLPADDSYEWSPAISP